MGNEALRRFEMSKNQKIEPLSPIQYKLVAKSVLMEMLQQVRDAEAKYPAP